MSQSEPPRKRTVREKTVKQFATALGPVSTTTTAIAIEIEKALFAHARQTRDTQLYQRSQSEIIHYLAVKKFLNAVSTGSIKADMVWVQARDWAARQRLLARQAKAEAFFEKFSKMKESLDKEKTSQDKTAVDLLLRIVDATDEKISDQAAEVAEVVFVCVFELTVCGTGICQVLCGSGQ